MSSSSEESNDFTKIETRLIPYMEKCESIWLITATESPVKGYIVGFKDSKIIFNSNGVELEYNWRGIRHIFGYAFKEHLYQSRECISLLE